VRDDASANDQICHAQSYANAVAVVLELYGNKSKKNYNSLLSFLKFYTLFGFLNYKIL